MSNKSKQLALSDAAETAAVGAGDGNRPVFVETSLGTRLAMNLSLADTVSDFKRKVEKEHKLSFSDIGDIEVHALKVKRRGQFYRLSDSLLVKEAFGFVTKNWFLSVDSSLVEKNHDERPGNPNNLDRVDLQISNGDDDEASSEKRRELEIEVLEKPGESSEEVLKKRKRETEQKVPDGVLREPVEISQPVLVGGDKIGNVWNGLDSLMSKKRKASNGIINQISEGVGEKTLSESSEISKKHKNSNNRVVGSQGLLDAETLHKAYETDEGKEIASEDIMETSEHHIPVDAESNLPPAINKTVDIVQKIGVSGNKDVGTSCQAQRSDEQLKKNYSDRNQSNDLNSTFSVETETNRNALDVSIGLMDEIGSVVPSNIGKKSKSRRKKAVCLDENVVTKSSVPDLQVSGTEVSAEPLQAKSNEQKNEHSMNEEIQFPPKDGNEVNIVENKEKDPVKRRLKKKQNSEKSPSDVLEKEDAVPQNPTPPAFTKSEAVASSKAKKKGKTGKLESVNLGAQNLKVTDESKSTDKTRDIKQGIGETETSTPASNKMEALKDLQTGILELVAVSNNDGDSLKVQSTNEIKANDANTGTINLAGENNSSIVLPTKVGKKRKTTKKTKGLGENSPLGAKPDLVAEDEPVVKKISRKRQKNLPDVQVGLESEKQEKVQNASVFAEPKSVTNLIEVYGTRNKITSSNEAPLSKKKVPKAKADSVQTSSNVRSSTRPNGNEKINSATLLVQEASFLEEKSSKSTVHPDAKLGTGETEPTTPVRNKMEASKDLQTDILEKGAVLNNDGVSLKVQSINVVKAKDAETSTVNLAGENTISVVLPTEVGKKRKTSKQTKGLGENLPLGAKPDLVVEEEPVVKKISKKRQKNLPDVQVGPESEKQEKVQNKGVFAEPKSVINQIEVSGTGNKITSSNEALLSKKKVPKAKADSVQMSSNVQSSTKPNAKEKINSTTVLVQEASLLEEKSGESTVHPGRKPAKASKSNSANLNSVSKETLKPNVVEKSDAKVLMKSSEPKKRLVSTPGSIFKDNSDRSSDDDDEGSDDSNSSTRTPSNYSSDYSDGEESNANSKLLQKEGTKSVDRRSILKSCASGGKDITFDTIIRSSRRYKKAIVTGSELQPNDESQQVDFVPDSQPVS